MRQFIVGIDGFSGRHLYELLARDCSNVVAGSCMENAAVRNRLFPKAALYECNVLDMSSLQRALQDFSPDVIYHFAAVVPVASSVQNPAHSFQVNVIGTIHLLECIRNCALDPVILIPGSSEEYGPVKREECPVREEAPTHPANLYGVSKVSQSSVGFHYFRSHGLKVVRSRTFNYTGPGQPGNYVCSSWARQIAEIRRGKRDCLRVGNLDVTRDFSDVRDVVRAYELIVRKGVPGQIYNVCSARGVDLRTVLEKLLALADVEVVPVVDQALLRPVDSPYVIGDNSKLVASTGWKPEISLEQTLHDLLQFGNGRP